MMESIEPKSIKISILFGILLFCSCQKQLQKGKLECILNSIDVDAKNMNILVNQQNGWSDTTALIIVTYYKKSRDILFHRNLKGTYKGNNIYFNQSNVDTSDTQSYEQIPNKIDWNKFKQKITNHGIIQPPYDPISIQVEYNIKRNCVEDVIKGKGYINRKIMATCNCCH